MEATLASSSQCRWVLATHPIKLYLLRKGRAVRAGSQRLLLGVLCLGKRWSASFGLRLRTRTLLPSLVEELLNPDSNVGAGPAGGGDATQFSRVRAPA